MRQPCSKCPTVLRKQKKLTTFAYTKHMLRHVGHRPDGGIGRRDGLKHRWSNPSRFEPGSGYEEALIIMRLSGLLFLQGVLNVY